MPIPMSSDGLTLAEVALAEALTASMVHPAAVVQDASIVVAASSEWRALRIPDGSGDDAVASAGARSMARGADRLKQAMLGAPSGTASISVVLPGEGGGRERAFIARWRPLGLVDAANGHLALVELEDHDETRRLAATVRSQSARIDHLLMRQTLIEEAERRRLGRALHDDTAQTIGEARRRLAGIVPASPDVVASIELLDRAVASIRDLVFDLSPPVLQDLGLLPALRWLADDLERRRGMRAVCTDDGIEPPLSRDVRTIAFRVVRELAMNAVKHAPGAEVVVSSSVDDRTCRLTVRDSGPGFEPADVRGGPAGRPMYGLLSVEQQVLAVGGAFAIASAPDDGTRAVVTLPLEPAPPAEGFDHA